MPHLLSDRETSLLLRHLLQQPASLALVPVIQGLHSCLLASHSSSSSPYDSYDSENLFQDFLESGEPPENSSDAGQESPIPDRYSLSLDTKASLDGLSDALSGYMSDCDYFSDDPPPTSASKERFEMGIFPSMIFQDVVSMICWILVL